MKRTQSKSDRMILKIIILALMVISILPSCDKSQIKPNILLITIDTLRCDHLGVYGYPRETSPFIDQLARSGLRFTHAVTPQAQTCGSHASILTSLHPLTHGITFNALYLDGKFQTLAEVLKKNGYYTIGAVAVGILSGKFNFSQGFDSFADQWKKNPRFKKSYQRVAQAVNKSLLQKINKYLSHHKSKPLFIWVHYYDPHMPYIGRKNITFRNKLPDEKEKNKKIKRYDKEIRYTDDTIRELYKYLEEKGIAQRLLTCITSDHGEQLGEHGYAYGHPDFYSETTFVPLIFHGYGVPKNKVIDTYVSTMDIAVTLLGAANLQFDYPTEGIDLLKTFYRKKRRPGSQRKKKFLIISTPKHARSLQLVGNSFAYILNFDHHYKYWYISSQNDPKARTPMDENRFNPIQKQQIKQENHNMIISLPQCPEKGLNYAVLRGDIQLKKKKTADIGVEIKNFPRFFTDKVQVQVSERNKNQTIEVIYPVTIVDRITVHLCLERDTGIIINNLRYAFIPVKEFIPGEASKSNGAGSGFYKKITNKIWETFLTPRKWQHKDELFDLSKDIKMEKNLVDADIDQLKSTIMTYRKLIYTTFGYYKDKNSKLLKGIKSGKELSEEDEKMLKSLGYL